MGVLERARSILRTETQTLLARARDGAATLRGLMEDLEEDILEVEEAAVRSSRESEQLQEDSRRAEAASETSLDEARDHLKDDEYGRARRAVTKHLREKRRARKLTEKAAERGRYARELRLLVEPLSRKLDEVRTLARNRDPAEDQAAHDDGPDLVEAILAKLEQEIDEDPDTAPGVPKSTASKSGA